MRRYIELAATLIVSAIVLGGCAHRFSAPAPSPPSDSTSSCTPLEASGPGNLVELLKAGTTAARGEVVAVHALPSSDVILSLHIGNPSLVRWRLWDPGPIMEADLGVASRLGAGFSPSGNIAMGATTTTKPRGVFERTERVGGVLLWDTVTGELVSCIEAPCPRREPSGLSIPTLVGATLHPKGNWALIFNELAVVRVSLPDVAYEQVYGTVWSDMDVDDLTTIGAVAFDYSGERYAVGLEEGQVVIIRADCPWWDIFRCPDVLGSRDPSDLRPIPAMAFSPDGEWLAQARGEAVRVWDLRSSERDPAMQLEMTGAYALAYDLTSKYLFVAAADKLSVIELANGKALAEYRAPGISALTVSPDNRLLVWGDRSGLVHALGDCAP